MYKITRSKEHRYKYDVRCYFYIQEGHFYSQLYSLRNLSWLRVAQLLKGRIMNKEELSWIHTVLSLTTCPAIITDTGYMSCVLPVIKDEDYGKRDLLQAKESTKKPTPSESN